MPGRARAGYPALLADVLGVLETARTVAARSINTVMTATYWDIGRRIVEEEQRGASRAQYGEELLDRLSKDLTSTHGRGFGRRNLFQMRAFYLTYRFPTGATTASSLVPSSRQIVQTASAQSAIPRVEALVRFHLPWSHYVRLLSIANPEARAFYETEALRSGWTVRQLTRQIDSQFYERTLLSKDKAALLRKGAPATSGDASSPEEEIKDPFVLEFLGLKDEYSESELEAALISRIETFLLELGGDFTFVGRQRRLRIGDEWYRVDLLFFHRRLRCLVVVDLKLGKFSHADAGQMHLYLNYAREHWVLADENPPVGLILCAQKDSAVARYALEGLPNKVLAAEYRMALPDEQMLAAEVGRTRRLLKRHRS